MQSFNAKGPVRSKQISGNQMMGKVMLLKLQKAKAAKGNHVDEGIDLRERPSCKTACMERNDRIVLTRGFQILLRYVRNHCGIKFFRTALGCLLVQPLLALLLTMPAYSMEPDNASKDAPKGRYVLQLAAPPDSSFCKDFTANLNQFRNLDFDSCAPRLSPKYPQLVRPTWEPIPWDMDIAKEIITKPINLGWDRWLKFTEAARASGEVKLWRLEVDILGDGHLETIVRLDHTGLGGRPYCSYFDSRQRVLNAAGDHDKSVFSSLYIRGGGLGNDLIYDALLKHYYLLDWDWTRDSSGHGEDIYIGRGNGFKTSGATASVMAYSIDVYGISPACWIDWVPTKHH